MDLLTRADLDQLAAGGPGTHVSLFLPTHRLASEDRSDPLRWKNLLTGTASVLADHAISRNDIDELLAPAWALHRDAMAWQYMSGGLAMFLRPGWQRSYRVPAELTQLATVGERFVTGPLLKLLTADRHFLLLTLSQRDVRLLEGTMLRLEQVELRDVPTDLRDIIEPPEARSDTMTRSLSPGRPGGRAVFYGHGTGGKDVQRDEIDKFLRQVTRGLDGYLNGQNLPLVLVGLEDLVAAYRSLNSYPHLLDEELRTNPDGMALEKLHEGVWPLIEQHVATQRATALDRYAQAHGTGRVSTVAGEIEAAARQGRVDTLFVAAEPWCWDQLSRERTVVVLGEVGSHVRCELLDRAVTATLTHGGQVYALPAAEAPDGADVAAILRY